MPQSKLTFCCNDHMLYYIALCVVPSNYPYVSWHHHMTERVEVCSTCQSYLGLGEFSFVIDDVCRDAFMNYSYMQDSVSDRCNISGVTPYNRYMLESIVTTKPSSFTIDHKVLTDHLINIIGMWINLMTKNGMYISISFEDALRYIYQCIIEMPNENFVTNMGTLILVNLGNILSQFFEQFIPSAMFYVAQIKNINDFVPCNLIDTANEIQCAGFYYPSLHVALHKINQQKEIASFDTKTNNDATFAQQSETDY